MTTYEHAMLGLTLALAVGAQRRHGWALPATAAVAAALPDWDVVSLFFGADAYRTIHRTWGHNLLCAGLLGALTGGLGYCCYLSVRLRRRLHQFLVRDDVKTNGSALPYKTLDLLVWVMLCIMAGLFHLLADLLYPWPIPLLWPFDERRWVFPILPWADMPPILLLLGEMFTLYYHPRYAQLIAWLTLFILTGYVAVRWAWPLTA
jgi:membrane-bound metal-dependent hydrolase YbcI (DUF457 family)